MKEDVLNTSFSFPVIEKGWNIEALLGFNALIFLAAYFSQVCQVLKESISSCLQTPSLMLLTIICD